MSKKVTITTLKRKLSKNPKDTSALALLADKYRVSGKFQQSMNAFERLLKLTPDNYQALNNYGALLRNNEQFDASYKTLLKADQLLPNSPIILTNLANTYFSMTRYDLSITSAFRAVSIDPDFFDAYTVLSDSYAKTGQIQLSIDCLNTALTLKPDDRTLISLLAKNHYLLNNYQHAYELIKPLIKINAPECCLIYFDVSKKLDIREQAVSYLKNIIDSNGSSEAVIAQLHLCLGEHYDKTKEYDKAMKEYHLGNKLFKINFDIAEVKHSISNTIDTYSANAIKKLKRASNHSKQPIFIVGMPRTGTSLMEQIIAAHTQVYGAGELGNIDIAIKEATSKFNTKKNPAEVINKLDTPDLDIISNKYLAHINKVSANADYVTDKMPHNFLHIGFIKHIFPDAKIINCMRHPLDTCLSCYSLPLATAGHSYAFNLTDLGNYYLEYERLMEHWMDIFEDSILQVRYDDLITDHENTSKQIIDFCGLVWDNNCLNFYNNDRIVNTFSRHQANKPIYTKSLQRWKNYEPYLTDLKNILNNSMERYESISKSE